MRRIKKAFPFKFSDLKLVFWFVFSYVLWEIIRVVSSWLSYGNDHYDYEYMKRFCRTDLIYGDDIF